MLDIVIKFFSVAPVGCPPQPSLSPDSDGNHRGGHWGLNLLPFIRPAMDAIPLSLLDFQVKCRCFNMFCQIKSVAANLIVLEPDVGDEASVPVFSGIAGTAIHAGTPVTASGYATAC